MPVSVPAVLGQLVHYCVMAVFLFLFLAEIIDVIVRIIVVSVVIVVVSLVNAVDLTMAVDLTVAVVY